MRVPMAALSATANSRRRFSTVMMRLRESRWGMVGASLVLFWVMVALSAPLLAPFSPNTPLKPFAPPGTRFTNGTLFVLGTDHLGRDILSRIIYGARRVLFYAPLATAAAYAVGVVMGLVAGYAGGWLDTTLSRLSDIILAFPVLVLYVIVIAMVGASGLYVVLAITLANAPGIMRLVRGLVLTQRQRDYVAAAHIRGEGAWRMMLVEILPNLCGPLIADICLRLGYVIITLGTLGFLGLGLPPPDPDWGGMVNETRAMAQVYPWMTLFPCLAIASLVLGLNLLADGVRDLSRHA